MVLAQRTPPSDLPIPVHGRPVLITDSRDSPHIHPAPAGTGPNRQLRIVALACSAFLYSTPPDALYTFAASCIPRRQLPSTVPVCFTLACVVQAQTA